MMKIIINVAVIALLKLLTYLIIKIATNDRFLDIRCSLSVFVVKSNAVEYVRKNEDDRQKQDDGEVTIDLGTQKVGEKNET